MNKCKKIIKRKNEMLRQYRAKVALLEKQLSYYRNLALIDNLTNLYNRRAVQETEGYSSVIFADIDHFKEINDAYGHDEGDKLLRELGEFFRNNIRETDCAIRWGGDEFLILLRNCPVEEAFEKANQLKAKLIEFSKSFDFDLTMSFGVSNLGNKSLEETVKEADSAMYESKEAGRDKVTLYELK